MKYAFAFMTLVAITSQAQAQRRIFRPFPYGGQTASVATYCADRPERCPARPRGGVDVIPVYTKIVPTPEFCSQAGDQTSRPYFMPNEFGELVFAGYECIQDNRGN